MILRLREHQRSTQCNQLQHRTTQLLDSEELGSAVVSATSTERSIQVRDQEAGGSNPLAPTDLFNHLLRFHTLTRSALWIKL
jgi:hypothetical protein